MSTGGHFSYCLLGTFLPCSQFVNICILLGVVDLVFTDAEIAAMVFYGLWHVLVTFDLTDEQRATLTDGIARAKRFVIAAGGVLYDPKNVLPTFEK